MEAFTPVLSSRCDAVAEDLRFQPHGKSLPFNEIDKRPILETIAPWSYCPVRPVPLLWSDHGTHPHCRHEGAKLGCRPWPAPQHARPAERANYGDRQEYGWAGVHGTNSHDGRERARGADQSRRAGCGWTINTNSEYGERAVAQLPRGLRERPSSWAVADGHRIREALSDVLAYRLPSYRLG